MKFIVLLEIFCAISLIFQSISSIQAKEPNYDALELQENDFPRPSSNTPFASQNPTQFPTQFLPQQPPQYPPQYPNQYPSQYGPPQPPAQYPTPYPSQHTPQYGPQPPPPPPQYPQFNVGIGGPVAGAGAGMCPPCDASVYSYCSLPLIHDACCCNFPVEYEKPMECYYNDCSFLYAKSCYEHSLIMNCCCNNNILY